MDVTLTEFRVVLWAAKILYSKTATGWARSREKRRNWCPTLNACPKWS